MAPLDRTLPVTRSAPAVAQRQPAINRVLHTMARVQLRNPTEGRAYYDRKKANGKAPTEAMRW